MIFKLLKWLKRVFYATSLLALLVFFFLLWLIFTESGLAFTVYLSKTILLGPSLQIERVSGQLSNEIHLQNIQFENDTYQLNAKEIIVAWQPLAFLKQGFTINNVLLEHATLTIKSKPSSDRPPAAAPEPFSLPKQLANIETWANTISRHSFHLQNLALNDVIFVNEDQPYRVNSLLIKQLAFNQGHLKLQAFNAETEKVAIQAHGQWSLPHPERSQFVVISSKGLVSETLLSGRAHQMQLHTKITAPYQSQITLTVDTDKGANALHFSVDANHQQQVLLKGQGELHRLPSVAWKTTLTLRAQEIGSLIPSLSGSLHATFLSHGHISQQTTKGKTQVKMRGKLQGAPLSANAKLQHASQALASNISWGKNTLAINGQLSLPLAIKAQIPDTTTLHPALRSLHTRLDLEGELSDSSFFKLTIGKGWFSPSLQQKLFFQGGQIQLKALNQKLALQGNFNIDKANQLRLDGTLDKLNAQPLTKQPFKAALYFSLNNLKFIDSLIVDVSHTQGTLIGSLNVGGTLQTPNLTTDLHLKNGTTHITGLGAKLTNIQANLTGEPNHFQLDAHINSGQGHFNFRGSAKQQPQHFLTQLQVTGDNATLFNTDEYKISISPDVLLESDNEKLFLKGTIKIPYADISPQDFTSTVELPDDVVITSDKQPVQRAKSLQIGYQVAVELGEDIHLAVMGLSGKIKGQLALNAPYHQMTRATGRLSILEGKYQAYGQNLTVYKGELIFSGSPLNNPGIDIEAGRTFDYQAQYATSPQSFSNQQFSQEGFSDTLTVGLHLTGRLKSPKAVLFSNPANQSQADILSLLVLGRSATQATSEGDSKMLLGALASLNLGGGNNGQQLTQQIQHALGLDKLGIETQSTYDEESGAVTDTTALVLGKSLSSKLSLSYSIGLSQAIQILKIRYQLTPRWTVQTETNGSINGIDILYNYHRK